MGSKIIVLAAALMALVGCATEPEQIASDRVIGSVPAVVWAAHT